MQTVLKTRIRSLHIVLALLCTTTLGLLTFSLEAQDKAQEIFASLEQEATKAAERFKPGSEGASLAKRAAQAVSSLQNTWRTSKEKIPSEYLKTLAYDRDLISEAVNVSDNEKAEVSLREATADLEVKSNQARNAYGAVETLGAEVNVIVRTRKDGQEASGYLVRCNPRRYGTQTTPMFLFNNPSSPTSRNLPPGNFVLWLEKGSMRFGRLDVTIGGDGSPKQTILFDVP